jgi:PAS domain S-box-containing protein
MHEAPFLALLHNAALLVSMGLLYDLAATRLRAHSITLRHVPLGLILGTLGVAVMLTPWAFTSGIVFDTRSVLLGVSGLFFGTVPTVIAMAMTAMLRLAQGGQATLTGLSVILASGALGILWRYVRRKHPLSNMTWKELYLFGLAIHLVMLALMFTLPLETAWRVLADIGLPVLAIYPVATLACGWMMVIRLRRDQAALALRESEERYRAMIDSFDGQIYICSQDHLVEFANQQVITRVGYNPIGHSCHQAMYGRPSACPWCVTDRVFKGETVRRELQNPADNRWYLTIDTPIHHADGSLSKQSMIMDITERKQAEKQVHEAASETRLLLEAAEQSRHALLSVVEDQKRTEAALLQEKSVSVELQQQLQQAAKMDAIGRLAGGVAHDFNNLLQAILGFTEILISQSHPGHSGHEDLIQIKKAGTRAADLTRQLLAFGRKQMIEPRVLDLNTIIAGAEPMLRRLLGEDIRVQSVPAPRLPHIKADPGQIEQIIVNLAVNARDAMPNGGRLTLGTSSVILQTVDTGLIPEARPGHYVCLCVSDTGTGMPGEVLQHLFEPFFSTKELGKGTGLGLAVTYGIVKQNNGWINVYSQVEHGTTFRIYFPVNDIVEDDPPGPFPLNEQVAVAPKGRGERILLVEDELGVRTLATTVLRNHGYDVLPSDSAGQATELFDHAGGRIDLLFSDVVLPGMNGIELADQLLALNPELPVLLSSGYADERARWNKIEDRGYHFLQKPYPVDTLLHTVRHILDRTDDRR